MLNKMLSLAATMHNTQVDLAGVQYIFHIMRVTDNCRQMWGHTDEELLAIAAGHDLLEDTVCSYETILFEFGERVADGIKSLSKYKGQTYEEYKVAVLANKDAMRVKLADLKDNMDISRYGENYDVDKVAKRFQKYAAEHPEDLDDDEFLPVDAKAMVASGISPLTFSEFFPDNYSELQDRGKILYLLSTACGCEFWYEEDEDA